MSEGAAVLGFLFTGGQVAKHTIDLRNMPLFHEEMPMGAGAPDLERPVIDGIVAGEVEIEMPAWLKRRIKRTTSVTAGMVLLVFVLSNINFSSTLTKPRTVARSITTPTTIVGASRAVTASHPEPEVVNSSPKISAQSADAPTGGVGGGQPVVTPIVTPATTVAPDPSPAPAPVPTPAPNPAPTPTP